MRVSPQKLLNEIVSIYSPTGKEQALAKFLEEALADAGIEARRDRVGNVLASVGQGCPHILLCGHTDTVPGELPVRISDGIVHGRGTVDAKGALTAMLVATSTAKPAKGTVIFAGVVDEEGASRGMHQLIADKLHCDLAIFGEPSGVDSVTIGYKGSVQARITLTAARTGHSASPWLYENAVERTMNLWRDISKQLDNETTSKFESLTGCVTSVEGGGVAGRVPGNCTIEMDLRVPPSMHSKQVAEIVHRVAEAQQSASCAVKTEILSETEPLLTDRTSILVRSFRKAVRAVCARPVTLLKKTGTSDANLLTKHLNVEAVAYGPGDSKLDHTDEERLSLSEFSQSIDVLRHVISDLSSA